MRGARHEAGDQTGAQLEQAMIRDSPLVVYRRQSGGYLPGYGGLAGKGPGTGVCFPNQCHGTMGEPVRR